MLLNELPMPFPIFVSINDKTMEDIKAVIITIGDELLIGQTVDTNSAWMAQRLNQAGIWLKRRIAIADEPDDILSTLEAESRDVDIILITGGLGPTDDDKTKAVLCTYFGAKLVLNEEILAHVAARVAHYNMPMLERNRQQAMIPDTCEPLFNKRGTAPGLWFKQGGKVYAAMPGVPYEMEGLMENEILPRLSQHFQTPDILHRTIITTGVPEALLAEKLSSLEQSLPPSMSLAYLPGNGILKLRLTTKGTMEQRLASELDQYGHALENLIPDAVIAGEDLSLQQLAGNALRKRGWTVATAESCTGGYISHLLTSVPGSSAYFQGAMVTYSNDLKQYLLGVPEEMLKENGAVSEAVVKAMLLGVTARLNTNAGIAVSGIMGPDGGMADKPVGTVWIAAGNKEHLLTRKLQLRYGREKNIEMTGNYALVLLLEAVKNSANS